MVFRIRRRLCIDSQEHLVDHRPHPAGQPDEEAMEPAGGGQRKCPTEAGGGASARGSVADERNGGGKDCRHDNAELGRLRSQQVSTYIVQGAGKGWNMI